MDDLFDAEPEDSWDATDALVDQLDNVIRRVELLTGHGFRSGATDPADVLDAVEHLIARARRRHPSARDLVRAEQLDADIAFVRTRL